MSSNRDTALTDLVTETASELPQFPSSFGSYLIDPNLPAHVLGKLQANSQYPIREYRYHQYGPSRNHQACYTEEDIQLLNKINATYTSIIGNEKRNSIFNLNTQTQWYDLWQCTKPADTEFTQQLESQSFTLPHHDAKDTRTYPLWSYADNRARSIANWQSERIRHQDYRLMNDPVMLVYQELRDWYYYDLAERECNKSDIAQIERRQSYIKHLVHLIPDFGSDRRHLNELNADLDKVNGLILNCVASRELPELLSDIVRTGKNLESVVGTYLHFILIDERVTDNYSNEYLDNNLHEKNCVASPICKVYLAAQQSTESAVTQETYQHLSKFFAIDQKSVSDGKVQIQTQLKLHLLSTIKFANFVSEGNKKIYLETLASLDALMKIRKTLEHFQGVQTKIGTYMFAHHYLESANLLAENYLQLITKTKGLIRNLVGIANDGLNSLLDTPNKKQSEKSYFEKNLRALETKVTKETTISAQLENYCTKADESMRRYQSAMKKIAVDIQSGDAEKEVYFAMQSLFKQIDQLNAIMPAILNDAPLIEESAPTQPHLPDSACDKTTENNQEQCEMMRFELNENPRSVTDPIMPQTQTSDLYAEWDSDVETDVITHEPIFKLRVYNNMQDREERGSISFYGQPMLCRSADNQKNNIVRKTGEFSTLDFNETTEINQICHVLPPSLFDKVLYSAQNGAVNGIVRGSANVIGLTLKTIGVPKKWAAVSSQMGYYGFVFYTNYAEYCAQQEHYKNTCNELNALTYAAIATGKIFLTQCVLNSISNMFAYGGQKLEESHWTKLGRCVKSAGGFLRYGLFAYNAASSGAIEATTALASGAATEYLIENGAMLMINKFDKK